MLRASSEYGAWNQPHHVPIYRLESDFAIQEDAQEVVVSLSQVGEGIDAQRALYLHADNLSTVDCYQVCRTVAAKISKDVPAHRNQVCRDS